MYAIRSYYGLLLGIGELAVAVGVELLEAPRVNLLARRFLLVLREAPIPVLVELV